MLAQVSTALSGETPWLSVGEEAIQQMYILYFYETGTMPDGKMNGKTFAEFALAACRTNQVVQAHRTGENRNRLTDMLTVDRYLTDTTVLTYAGRMKS